MFLPFGQKAKSEAAPERPIDSTAVKRHQNLSNWHFRMAWFSIGLTATNVVRVLPDYLLLYICTVVVAGIALMVFPPADRDYQGLWRTGGLTLYFGTLLAWWDGLRSFRVWQIQLGFACGCVLLLVVVAVLGAIGGKAQ